MEREISFRTESGLYYSYYKQLVVARSFYSGIKYVYVCCVYLKIILLFTVSICLRLSDDDDGDQEVMRKSLLPLP